MYDYKQRIEDLNRRDALEASANRASWAIVLMVLIAGLILCL